jgi:hypothetical protein
MKIVTIIIQLLYVSFEAVAEAYGKIAVIICFIVFFLCHDCYEATCKLEHVIVQ